MPLSLPSTNRSTRMPRACLLVISPHPVDSTSECHHSGCDGRRASGRSVPTRSAWRSISQTDRRRDAAARLAWVRRPDGQQTEGACGASVCGWTSRSARVGIDQHSECSGVSEQQTGGAAAVRGQRERSSRPNASTPATPAADTKQQTTAHRHLIPHSLATLAPLHCTALQHDQKNGGESIRWPT